MTPRRLTILGCSAGLASAHRASSSYLLDCGEHGVLIDCGDGATRNFLGLGRRPEWISDVFISHTHADHVCGLGYFLQQRYLSRTDRPLTIHCPEEAIAPLTGIFAFGYMFLDKLPFETHFEPHRARHPVRLHGLEFVPHPTSHLMAGRAYAVDHGLPNRGECFALQVNYGHGALVYSADLGSLNDLDSVRGPVDCLLVETTHVPLDRLWPWVAERSVRKVVLTHLTDDFDPTPLADAPKYTSAEIVIAEDRMVVDLP